MQKWLREMALCFSAGSVGALAKGGAIWLCAHFAVLSEVASHLARAQSSGFYARIVWGGIAAFLFLLPLARKNWLVRGLFCGVIVALIQLFAIPLLGNGSVHFALLPMLSVLALSCIWGLATAGVLRLSGA